MQAPEPDAESGALEPAPSFNIRKMTWFLDTGRHQLPPPLQSLSSSPTEDDAVSQPSDEDEEPPARGETVAEELRRVSTRCEAEGISHDEETFDEAWVKRLVDKLTVSVNNVISTSQYHENSMELETDITDETKETLRSGEADHEEGVRFPAAPSPTVH
jgi:hypothetical protein